MKTNNKVVLTKQSKDGSSPAKVANGKRIFKMQLSTIDQLVSTNCDFRAVHDLININIFLIIVCCLVRGSVKAGRPYFNFSMAKTALGSLSSIVTCLCLVVCLQCAAFLVHPFFKGWCYLRLQLPRFLVDILFVFLYIAYIIVSAISTWWVIFNTPLGVVTTFAVAVEQLRVIMKSYSFIRENVYKILYPWHKDDESGPAVWYEGQMEPSVGSFSKYFYFLFSPTLLYRDNYPRTKGPVNWTRVFKYLFQVLANSWITTVLYRDYMFPDSLSSDDLWNCYLNCLLCTPVIMILFFTQIIHCYSNLVGELTRFGDRFFYSNWWTSTTFSTYYRKWNGIIHDWIHTYIYSDLKAVLKSKIMAMFVSILLSAAVHEYFIALSLRFVSPTLIIQFAGLGAIFYLMPPLRSSRNSNYFVLLALVIGAANLLFYYQVEYAARKYCPKQLDAWTFVKPRLFECYYITNYNMTVYSHT